MKRSTIVTLILVLAFLTIGVHSHASAQFRDNLQHRSDLTTDVVKDPSEGAKLSNLFNMQMDHSYSIMFTGFGGQMHNMNAYTNTMRFFFSERLTGRVDLSLLHSPFGNSFMQPNGSNDGGFGAKLILRNAELDYKISDNSHIRVQFQQIPGGYGPWGYRQNAFSPYRRPFF